MLLASRSILKGTEAAELATSIYFG
jgi:hypothetical protein